MISSAALALVMAYAQGPAPERRPITVSDVIELASFSGDPPLRGDTETQIDAASPDGKLHAVLVRRGNIRDNTNIFSLLLFRTDQLFNHPAPDTLLTLASSSNRPAISLIRWLSDNRTIAFLGEHRGEQPQVSLVDVYTRRLTQRSRWPTEIVHYAIAPTGQPIVFTAEPAVDTSNYPLMRAHGFAVRRTQFVGDVLRGTWSETSTLWSSLRLRQTWISQADSSQPVLAQLPGPMFRSCDGRSLIIAPNGRQALIECTRPRPPPAWGGYTEPFLAKLLAEGGTIEELALLDLERGVVAPLVEAPIIATTVLWSPTSESVVLANALLPLEGVDSAEQSIRAAHAALAEVDVRTGKLKVIAHRDSLDVVAWDSASNIVDFVPGRYRSGSLSGPRVRYQQTAHGWREVSPRGPQARPGLIVEQGLNIPPRLVALNRSTGRRVVVLDPNPQLSGLQLTREEVIHWKTRSGVTGLGGLYYPAGFFAGRRYPLVIQTHGFDSTTFAPDGIYPTANAAQPMAAQGMFVLQVGTGDRDAAVHAALTPREAPEETEVFEGAIDYLDSLGLIDRNRVGIIGFSRTCYHVLYMLTHSRYAIAAAALTDGVDFGYLQYVLYSNARIGAGITLDEFGAINGGLPWGQAFDQWRARAPGFNLDQIEAPLRLEALRTTGVLAEWEPYAGLLAQRKPVELFVIPDGSHLLVKPWERLASSQGNADWFRFWLKGEEDSDPSKREQYARWREMRRLKRRQQPTSDTVAARREAKWGNVGIGSSSLSPQRRDSAGGFLEAR